MPPESGRRAGGVFANSRSISLIGARNGSVFGSETTSTSSGRMQSIQRQMSLSLRQVSIHCHDDCKKFQPESFNQIVSCNEILMQKHELLSYLKTLLYRFITDYMAAIACLKNWILQESALRPQSVSSLSSNSNQANPVWGWLQGEDSSMPNALLEGAGLAIGSSKEGFETRRHALCLATSETGSLQDTCPSRR